MVNVSQYPNFLILLLVLLLFSGAINAQKFNIALVASSTLKDTTNIYHQMLNDNSDDLMENHPADDIYNNIWTSERLNPYHFPVDSLPDSVRIDCSNFVLPIYGKVTSKFGRRRYRYHYGIDLRLNVGDSIRCAFAGKVRIIEYEPGGYGHYVVVRHDNGLETVYAHLSQVLVNLNQYVKAGQMIALCGNTGRSTGPHLHFETRYLGNAINPDYLIDFERGTMRQLSYLITKKNTFNYQKEWSNLQLARYHVVHRGDTLSEIASRYGTTVRKICNLNRISTKKLLKPGQKIRVK
ncbi:MAG: peptidoglycan DD-metalloendopeptidase family protein [Paludibacteraceae bacterium]|nr:peptidoglycan DD-metalloendopeptidase family protein [Paludibacteraceae bacterium]